MLILVVGNASIANASWFSSNLTTRQTQTLYNPKETPQTAAPSPQDVSSKSGPRVVGSSIFSRNVNKALDLLQRKAPKSWGIVTANLATISEVSSGSGAVVRFRTFLLSSTSASGDSNWVASIIVHDAFHVQQYREGRAYTGAQAEAEALAVQREALIALRATQWLSVLDQAYRSRYWEVPYSSRGW